MTDDVSHTSGSLKVALCMAPYMSTTDDVSKYVGKRFNCRDSNRFTMLVTWAMMPEGQGVVGTVGSPTRRCIGRGLESNAESSLDIKELIPPRARPQILKFFTGRA